MRTTVATGAIVATVLGLLEIIEVWTGWKSGITEDWIITALAVLAPLAAWFGRSA